MGNNEAATPPKSDKASSPVREQPASHPCPDWEAMQAYYGPGIPVPPPYFSATVAPGHVPHPYMWGPQPFMPPYAMPYAAIYPHGGVYSHSPVPLGSHSQGFSPSPITGEAVLMATPLSIEAPAKSSSNKDRGLMKKLKGFDGLAVSTGSGNGKDMGGDMNGLSQSEENGIEGSSGGSDGNTESGGNKIHRKRGSGDALISGDGKVKSLVNAVNGGEEKASSNTPLGVTVPPADVTGKPVGTVASSNPIPRMDFRLSSATNMKDERELKRERRKQSNRESARRSRLRKQTETEELALKVETLSIENMNLRSEISQLKKNSAKLILENSSLMEKLKDAQLGEVEEMIPDKTETQGSPSIVVENLLSRMDNPSSSMAGQEEVAHENSSGKLRQLLDSSPRTDAVAAG